MKYSDFSMIRRALMGAAFLFCVGALFAEPAIKLSTDRESALYSKGESAKFTLEVTDNGERVTSGTVKVKFGVAGGKDLLNQEFDLAQANPVVFEGTLEEPGFLLATAIGISEAIKGKSARAGVAFDPLGIVSGNELPADFRSFWEEGRAMLADKLVKLEKLPAYSTAKYTSYSVTVEVLHGEHLYGFLTVPNQPGKYPVVVNIPGAGPGASKPSLEWADKGVISLIMNVHKFPVILGDADANARQYKERLAKVYYPKDQAGDRDRYHFRNVILGIDRVINEIAKRPDWDGKHLVMDGSSQGGGLSLILSGFNPHVTAAAANVPALCDHGAARFHRQAGWPNLAANNPKAAEVSAYYDVANFAPSIRCPVLVSAGFIDTTCSPASVYAAWNRIPEGNKTIFDMPRIGHSVSPGYMAKKGPWVNDQLGLSSASSDASQKAGVSPSAPATPSKGVEEKLAPSSAEGTRIEWLHRETFSDADWGDRWRVETEHSLVRIHSGGKGLEICNDPKNPQKTGGTTVWFSGDVPDHLAVRLRATNGPSLENNACNLNMILRATQADGAALIFGTRTGDYPELHREQNYIVTFTGGYKPGWSRVRRNPGFKLESEAEIRSEPGQTYELLYFFENGRLRTWINGKLVHDWTDSHPLPNGKLGLRTWHSDILIHSIDIGQILPAQIAKS